MPTTPGIPVGTSKDRLFIDVFTADLNAKERICNIILRIN